MRPTKYLMAAAAAAILAAPALAHTPYLAPVTFAPDRDYVTVQGAMSESNFFVPDFPIRAAGDYWVTGPDGVPVKAGPGVNMKEMTVVEVSLPQEGTYRISTGARAGRAGKFAKVGEEWRSVRAAPTTQVAGPGAPAGRGGGGRGPGGAGGGERMEGGRGPAAIDESAIPAGAEVLESTTYLHAETYVTRGAPSKGALKATGKGFEVTPITHPNEIFAGDTFKLVMTEDGKPAANVEFSIARAGDTYAERKFSYSGKTDAAGNAAIKFAEPGAYVLETHYGQTQPGAKPSVRQVNYSLSFEVTK